MSADERRSAGPVPTTHAPADELAAARGVLVGAILGGAMWAAFTIGILFLAGVLE